MSPEVWGGPAPPPLWPGAGPGEAPAPPGHLALTQLQLCLLRVRGQGQDVAITTPALCHHVINVYVGVMLQKFKVPITKHKEFLNRICRFCQSI